MKHLRSATLTLVALLGAAAALPQPRAAERVVAVTFDDLPATAAGVVANDPPAYLLRVSRGVLVAQRFDAARVTVAGDPIPVAEAVGADDSMFHSAFSVSAAGVLAHRAGAAARRQLVWVDRTGKVLAAIGQRRQARCARCDIPSSGAAAR